MKQLVCEMCGGRDLIKDGGVFVCQTCGCKYTVEEARKMMIEGKVDVSGSTVKVDTSEKLNNLYTLARRAKNDDNAADAAKYYAEIRIEDPHSWEAAFYGVYYTAANCRIGQIESAANSVTNCLESVSKLIVDYVPKEAQKAAYTEFLLRAAAIGTMLFNASVNVYNDADYSNKANDFRDRAVAALTTVGGAGIMAERIFNDLALAKQIYESAVASCNSFHLSKPYAKIPQKQLDELAPKLRAVQIKKNEEYWQEHADEKKKLEEEKAQLSSEKAPLSEQIAALKRQENELPAVVEYESVQQEIADLTSRKNSLGFFKGKEKKALQEQIDALNRRSVEINKAVNVQKEEHDKNVAPLRIRLNAIDKRISEIDIELNKDR